MAPEDVGSALPHEHVLHSIGSIAASSDALTNVDIRCEDLVDYRRSPFAHGGRNLLLQKEDEAFRELEKLQLLGNDCGAVCLIVDVTVPVEGRDALMKERLQLAERLHNVHVVTVTTVEIETRDDDVGSACLPLAKTSECISKRLEAELMFGIDREGAVVFPGAMYQQIHATNNEFGTAEQVLVEGLALVWTLVPICWVALCVRFVTISR